MKGNKYIIIGIVLLVLGFGTCGGAYYYRYQSKQLFEQWYRHTNDMNSPEYIKATSLLKTGRTVNTAGVFVGLVGAIFVYAGILIRKSEVD